MVGGAKMSLATSYGQWPTNEVEITSAEVLPEE